MLFHSLIPVVMVSGPLENLHVKSKATQCTMYFADNSIEPVAKPFKLQTVENCFRYLEITFKCQTIALDIVAESRYTNTDWWRNGG